jgi:hypothetical protein
MSYERLTSEEIRERSFQRAVGWYEGKRVHPLTQELLQVLFALMIAWTLLFLWNKHTQTSRIEKMQEVFEKHQIDRKQFRTEERRKAWEEKYIGYRLKGQCNQ